MKLFYTLSLFVFSNLIFAQTSILKGTIIDDATGKTMPGVDVNVSNTKFYASSDFDGNFIIRDLPVGTYEVQFSTSSYRTKIISEVIVKANDATNLTVSLVESKNELKEVVITKTKAKVESIKSLLIQQKNSVSVSDGISAETIKRTPDKNTSDVLKRISGASIQDNKFVIVRGLNDRYNANYLNGAPLPSSESDRKAFSFDIFPSNMIDNLVITKTATPDLTGEFAGGVIQITTKNIPDQNFQSFSYGNGYNSLATGKTQRYYEGGKTDWLGIDDGTRALPSSIPSAKVFKTLDRRARIPFAVAMNSDWELKNKNFSPNVSFQYSIGKRYEIGEKTLGILTSISYSKSNVFDQTLRNSYETAGVISNINDDKNYREQVLLGALANFSLKINPNNSVSFKNIFSLNSDDRVVERDIKGNYTNPEPDIYYSSARWFTSNKIYTGQILGEHYLPKTKLKINWLGSFSDVDRSIPNLRRNIYKYDSSSKIWEARISDNTGGTDQGGGIFYSNNTESNKNAKIDLSKKLGNSSNHEIKTGLFYQDRNRNFSARQFHYTPFIEGNINFDTNILRFPTKEGDKTIFGPQNIGVISPTVGGFTLLDYSTKSDIYTASSELKAGYLMLDNKFDNYRLVWGVRSEEYRQLLDSDTEDKGPVKLDTKQIDFLPSANLIYALDSKRNLRLSYSKTLNRPEFRELAPFLFYDFTTQLSTQGDSKLKIASIQNYDFRFETYPGRNQLFSVSVFYKKFENPIEIQAQAGTTTVLYQNAGAAFNYGIEMEFRTQLSSLFHFEGSKLLDNLTVFSNISSISSEVDVTKIVATSNLEKKRQMQGQSPYVLNAGIQYSDTENGFNVAANLNRVGNRIAVGGNSEAEPTLWEKSRTLLDCQLSKTFLNKKMEVKLNVQNILAQDQIFYNNNDAIPFVAAKDNNDLPPSFFTLPDIISNGVKNTINRSFGNHKNWYNSETDDIKWKINTATTFSVSMSYNF